MDEDVRVKKIGRRGKAKGAREGLGYLGGWLSSDMEAKKNA